MEEKSRRLRRRPKHAANEDQMAFDFTTRINDLCETVQNMAECELNRKEAIRADQTKAEFYVEIAAACIKAIRASDLTRELVVDRINENWKRSEQECHGNRPTMTKAMLDKYLSNDPESRLPTWLVYAICEITGSLEPLSVQVEKLGGKIIAGAEKTAFNLGRIEAGIRQGVALRRELVKRFEVVMGENDGGLSD